MIGPLGVAEPGSVVRRVGVATEADKRIAGDVRPGASGGQRAVLVERPVAAWGGAGDRGRRWSERRRAGRRAAAVLEKIVDDRRHTEDRLRDVALADARVGARALHL